MALYETADSAADFFSSLGRVDHIAFDTEGATLYRYYDRVWLMQVATRDRSAILDPIGTGAPPALAALLASPRTEVVLHDAVNDLRTVQRNFGWRVTRIFDTRIAAQFLGVTSFGLAALLQDRLGIKVDKKLQRTDWSRRPLSAAMLDYAAQDTAHLLTLRDLLCADLQARGRMAWAQEEFDALERQSSSDDADDSDGDDDPQPAYLRVKGARDLTPRGLTLLRELWEWREAIAQGRDQAPYLIVGNEQLFAMATQPPSVMGDLSRIRGMPSALLRERGAELLALAARVRSLSEAALIRAPRPGKRPSSSSEARVARLKTVRDAAAAGVGLDPGFVCGRSRLEAIARAMPRTLDELARVDGMRRWWVDLCGPQLLAAL